MDPELQEAFQNARQARRALDVAIGRVDTVSENIARAEANKQRLEAERIAATQAWEQAKEALIALAVARAGG